MDGRKIFAKTHKGREEIATRQYKLPAKLRTALILVDGKTDAAHLIGDGNSLGERELEELRLLGFIQEAAGPAGEPVAASEAAVFPASGAIKTELIRISRDILGSEADKIVKKIEKSPDDKEALHAALKGCIEVVRLIVDEKKSKILEAQFNATLGKM